MFKIGLKLWSTNLNYISSARVFYEQGVFDYIELFTVPGSTETILQWLALNIPYVLHAPHSSSGLNLARADHRSDNLELARQVNKFFDALSPAFVIFHPGVDGDIEESLSQFRLLDDNFPLMYQKVVIENNPQVGLRDERCLGASPGEIRFLLDGTKRTFCLDFGHAICYSVAAGKKWKNVVADFLAMNPAIYHVSNGFFSIKDAHEHLGDGEFNLSYLIGLIAQDKYVTLETKKDHLDSLDDFVQDVQRLREYV